MIVWHLDRLYRRPRELEQLLDLLDTHPIGVETVQGGSFDLNRHEGRLFARQLVAFANYESALKGARVSRAHQQRARQGSWHGRASYGYQAGGTLHPDQAPVLRRIARDYLAGCSETEITRRLNAEGIAAPSTNGWHLSTVQTILRSDRLHQQRVTRTGERINGRWESVITTDESTLIRALQLLPQRRTTNSSRSLLGGLARCAACKRGMVVAYSGGGRIRRYVCLRRDGGCGNGIAADALDCIVRTQLSEVELVRTSIRPTHELDKARVLRQQLIDNVTAYVTGGRPHDAFAAISLGLQREIDQLSSAVVAATRTPDSWDELPLPEQRRMLQRRVVDIFIERSDAPGKFDPYRLRIEWRSAM